MDECKQFNSPIYLRIDADLFLKELTELGFKDEDAEEIVSWLKDISEQKIGSRSGRAFLSGKQSNIVKSCLAYIGSIVLDQPNYFDLTQQRIGLHFNVQSCFSRTYLEFVEFLKQKDSKFAVGKDTKAKYWIERAYTYDI